MRNLRWRVWHFKNKSTAKDKETYGFKSRASPPQDVDLIPFESDLLLMIRSIQFRQVENEFQKELQEKIRDINKDQKVYVPADKTRNFYKIKDCTYKKALMENITKIYKKDDRSTVDQINSEAKNIAKEMELDDRIDKYKESQARVTIKDHKVGFLQKPTYRLINPASTQMGIISRKILAKVNFEVRSKIGVNQWTSTQDTLKWFKGLDNKNQRYFLKMDITSFYPSITEKLLVETLEFISEHSNLSEKEKRIIMHSRKTLLFNGDEVWVKKNGKPLFDVAMGSMDGAEIAEAVGLLILFRLGKIMNAKEVGLYRDDLLAAIAGSKSAIERLKKRIIALFKEMDLKIDIATIIAKKVDYLGVFQTEVRHNITIHGRLCALLFSSDEPNNDGFTLGYVFLPFLCVPLCEIFASW